MAKKSVKTSKTMYNRVNGVITEIDGTIYRKELLAQRQKSFRGGKVFSFKGGDTIDIDGQEFYISIDKNNAIYDIRAKGYPRSAMNQLYYAFYGQPYDREKLTSILSQVKLVNVEPQNLDA